MWTALAGIALGLAAMWVAFELGRARERLANSNVREKAWEEVKTAPITPQPPTPIPPKDIGPGSKSEADTLLDEALRAWHDESSSS